MTTPGDLADAIASAGTDLLRSSVPAAATPTPDGSLSLEASLPLDGRRWVCVVADDSGRRWTVPVVRDGSSVRRAQAGDGVAEALVERIGAGPLEQPFALASFTSRPVRGERGMGVDQTNESVVVGDAAVVKWCLHLAARGNTAAPPAARRLAALATAGFDGMPGLWGLLSLDVRAEAPLLLANVTSYLPGALDGWDWATADARGYARGEIDFDQAVAPATAIGELIARMHVALAASGRSTATADDARRWASAAERDLATAVARIDGPEGDRLAASASQIAAELRELSELHATPLIDIHGDLHVGQVLRHSDPPAYAITDFDGNPVSRVDEHDDRQPAALDVAGMAASLDHVGRVVLRRGDDVDHGRVHTWIGAAEEAFMRSYRQTLGDMGAPDLLDERLLRPLRLWQECREFLYAAEHLPHWRYVPDQSLADLLGSAR
ncbi:MAG TPA: hypothetical protein VLK34_00355 [Nocardioidaceae bacterium]|nr:hypothetical protein [Nocardioidaceae bacterium]